MSSTAIGRYLGEEGRAQAQSNLDIKHSEPTPGGPSTADPNELLDPDSILPPITPPRPFPKSSSTKKKSKVVVKLGPSNPLTAEQIKELTKVDEKKENEAGSAAAGENVRSCTCFLLFNCLTIHYARSSIYCDRLRSCLHLLRMAWLIFRPSYIDHAA